MSKTPEKKHLDDAVRDFLDTLAPFDEPSETQMALNDAYHAERHVFNQRLRHATALLYAHRQRHELCATPQAVELLRKLSSCVDVVTSALKDALQEETP